MSRDLDTFIMDAMEEDPDDEIVAACSILLLSGLSASAVLLAVAEESKIKRSTWVKPYLRARDKYGVCSTLLPELSLNDISRYVQYLRMDVGTFHELLLLVKPKIKLQTTRFRYVGMQARTQTF